MPDHPANWCDFLEHASLSDVGLRRSNNQDAFSVVIAGSQQEWQRRGHLFMVADGMGAHAAGELASKLACTGVPHTYFKLADRPAPEAIHQAIVETNANIHNRGEANAEFHGMGTTTSVLTLLPEGAFIGHVGDSRVYRLRNHRLEQLTFDHSLVWEMTAAGQLPPGDVPSFVPKNIITRSLGPHAEVQVDLEGPFSLQAGDTFLLCSDGLTGQVKDEEIGVILDVLSPQEAVQVLVDLANLRGGPDNITVIIVRVTKPIQSEQGADKQGASAFELRQGLAAVHPALWVVGGVCCLAFAVLALFGQWLPALLSLVGVVVAAVVGVMQASSRAEPSLPSAPRGPLGSAPHTSRQCMPNAEAADNLAQIVKKLQEAAVDENWSVDWNEFHAREQRAQAGASSRQFSIAVREYALLISFLMSEIRQQQVKKNGDEGSVLNP